MYTYDAVGNITVMQHAASMGNWTRHYDYSTPDPDPEPPLELLPQSSNRLRATSTPSDVSGDPEAYLDVYEYDAHGNMTLMPSIPGGLTWDADDRLQQTDRLDASVTYYVYDGAGQRVRKVTVNGAGSTRKQRFYFGAWELYREEHNISTTPVLDLERATLHVHDDAGRICLIETKTAEDDEPIVDPANIARYQYSNHLGTASLELDDDAEVISYEEFHPYGTSSYSAANSAIEVSPKRYRYTGKERDEETGLGYHGARYYAPWLARWAAPDPIGLGDGVNRFSYVKSNPIKSSDPSGTVAKPATGLPTTALTPSYYVGLASLPGEPSPNSEDPGGVNFQIVRGRLQAHLHAATDTHGLSVDLAALDPNATNIPDIDHSLAIRGQLDLAVKSGGLTVDVTNYLPKAVQEFLAGYEHFLEHIRAYSKANALPVGKNPMEQAVLDKAWVQGLFSTGGADPNLSNAKDVWGNNCHKLTAIANAHNVTGDPDETIESWEKGENHYVQVTAEQARAGDVVVFRHPPDVRIRKASESGVRMLPPSPTGIVHSATLLQNPKNGDFSSMEVLEKRDPTDSPSTRKLQEILNTYADIRVFPVFLQQSPPGR